MTKTQKAIFDLVPKEYHRTIKKAIAEAKKLSYTEGVRDTKALLKEVIDFPDDETSIAMIVRNDCCDGYGG